jgi:hypothetical protein
MYFGGWEMVLKILMVCSRCGELTEWDSELGSEPLCALCWDAELEKDFEAWENEPYRRYRAEHREEIRENMRRYRAEHREEIRENMRRYYVEHREEILENMRRYRAEHRENKRRYRDNHRSEINEYSRKWRAKHRLPLSDGLDVLSKLASRLTDKQRVERAQKAALARWSMGR